MITVMNMVIGVQISNNYGEDNDNDNDDYCDSSDNVKLININNGNIMSDKDDNNNDRNNDNDDSNNNDDTNNDRYYYYDYGNKDTKNGIFDYKNMTCCN